MIVWKSHLSVAILDIREQFTHCLLEEPGSQIVLHITIVYARNEHSCRENLWTELTQVTLQARGHGFCGDFINVLSSTQSGSDFTNSKIQEFQGLLDSMQFTPLRSKGWNCTWSNKQAIDRRVQSKIDWALGDFIWIQQQGHIHVEYLNLSVSYHTLLVVKCHHHETMHPKSFRFFIHIMDHLDFLGIVHRVWRQGRTIHSIETVWNKSKI